MSASTAESKKVRYVMHGLIALWSAQHPLRPQYRAGKVVATRSVLLKFFFYIPQPQDY